MVQVTLIYNDLYQKLIATINTFSGSLLADKVINLEQQSTLPILSTHRGVARI